jgi:hypothetical protein
MTLMTRTLSAVACVYAAITPVVSARQQAQRPPAVPLVTSDPYFSIWSFADNLTDKPTTHWTGKNHRLTSLVRIDGKSFRLMGDAPADVPAMKQASLVVTPTQSIYTFEAAGVTLTLTFTSPLLPDDLMLLARPVTYLTWTAKSTDGQAHDTAVYFDASPELTVNNADQAVVLSRKSEGNLNVLVAGSEDQNVLQTSGDDRRIDWGHLYVASDAGTSTAAIAAPDATRAAFAAGNAMPADALTTGPAEKGSVLAIALPLGKVAADAVSRHVTLAYDDEVSIKYFRENLKPYWRKDGMTAGTLLTVAEKDYASLLQRCAAFDNEVITDLKKVGGESYAQLGVLAWRQALAAQKVCADSKGQPLSFSKENFSNGCIATVDVLYPASPQMMVFAPSLLKASLVPLLDYSASPLWKHDSAPHDLGTYPLAIGQAYGGEATSPMPVEESGNMLIMVAALAQAEGNADFAVKYWPVLTTWNNYLKEHGLDPANQLCTDDFAGHIARNANLSAKAIMGIASYAKVAGMLGKDDVAKQNMAVAKDYAGKWMDMADDGDHYRLVFGDAGKGTWSQKYNIAWDTILDLNVFPKDVAQKEVAFYKTKMNTFGLPLDSRKTYTKLDWEIWTATLAEKKEDFQLIVDACAKWANETPARVPLSDWYETDTGRKSGFQARSVVGGVYIALMKDESIWKKYAKRDKLNPKGWAELPWKMPPMKKLVAAADTAPATWKYTTTKPEDGWVAASFDDKAWKSGQSGFGTRGTPGAIIHTLWDTADIFMRREFTLPEGEVHNPQLLVHHDDNVEIYINGVLALKSGGFVTSYQPRPIAKDALATLKPGKNTLAVHCHQDGGGQYVDVGLVDVLPMPK